MPGALRRLLHKEKSQPIYTGCSAAEIYYLPEVRAYLKIARTGTLSRLKRERDVLIWLKDKLNVPAVLGYEYSETEDAILISAIEGIPASEYVNSSNISAASLRAFIGKSAHALRAIHALPIAECPFDQGLDAKMAEAWENISSGLVDESDFENENAGKAAAEIYGELLQQRPAAEDLVFTHGDFCLPNIIVGRNGDITGFIDLGGAGISDRYQDIALFLRSFRRNRGIGNELEALFCEGYGIVALDQQKVNFYRKLDELF